MGFDSDSPDRDFGGILARMKERTSSVEALRVATNHELDASGVVASGAGDRGELLAGKITSDEFLGRQVDRALEPLTGQLSPERLSHMRELLLLQLAQDPVLRALAAQAQSA